VVGVEAGLRLQLTPRLVWDVGIGTESRGQPIGRIFVRTALSFGF